MNKFTVEPLPTPLNFTGCAISSGFGRHVVFIKTPQGKIYHARRVPSTLDPVARWDCNAKDRSVYAKLAGIPVKDLTDARAAQDKNREKLEAIRDLARLKRTATRLGFALVKKRPPKPVSLEKHRNT